jgi:hypothetical protein
MTQEYHIKEVITHINTLRYTVEKECAEDVLKSLEAAFQHSTNEEFKHKLKSLHDEHKKFHGIQLKEFDYEFVEPNADKIIELIKIIKKSIAKNIDHTLTEIEAYQDSILKKSTLNQFQTELRILHDIDINDIDRLMQESANLAKTTKNSQVAGVSWAIFNRTLELKLYQALHLLFNHPETEYVKILQGYINNSKTIREHINRLNKPAQDDILKVIDKIQIAIKLCSNELNLAP